MTTKSTFWQEYLKRAGESGLPSTPAKYEKIGDRLVFHEALLQECTQVEESLLMLDNFNCRED